MSRRLWRIVLQTDSAPAGLHAADAAFDLAAAGHEVHAVTRESKPLYYALIEAFRELTGVPAQHLVQRERASGAQAGGGAGLLPAHEDGCPCAGQLACCAMKGVFDDHPVLPIRSSPEPDNRHRVLRQSAVARFLRTAAPRRQSLIAYTGTLRRSTRVPGTLAAVLHAARFLAYYPVMC